MACRSSGSAISRALAVVAAALAGWATSGCLADGCDAATGFVDDEAVGVGVAVGVHDVICEGKPLLTACVQPGNEGEHYIDEEAEEYKENGTVIFD